MNPQSHHCHNKKINSSLVTICSPLCTRWCTRTTTSSWSCHGWPSSATLKSPWTVIWCFAAKTWQPWTQSPLRPPSPTYLCPNGTPRRQDLSPLTFAPRNPAACCYSATAALRVPKSRNPAENWRLTTLPWSCWTGICTCWSIWALGKRSWRPATRRSMMGIGAMWIFRGKGGKVRTYRSSHLWLLQAADWKDSVE